MDDDLNELLLKKIKLDEDEQEDDNVTNDSSMDYFNSSDEERTREHLIRLLRTYIETKRERRREQQQKSMNVVFDDEDDQEDAQMFKSIRSMMLGSGGSGSAGGGFGSSSSNTTSLEEDDRDVVVVTTNNNIDDDGLDQRSGSAGSGNGEQGGSSSQQPPLLLGCYDVDESDDLPSNLIVTSLPLELFTSIELKRQFEDMFTRIHSQCRFSYFRLLKRCCVQYDEPLVAVLARLELDRAVLFDGTQLKMFLNKPIKLKNTRAFLEPPKNEKTFLISPPSSPPVGWEQHLEEAPIVNIDLLVALSKLDPHEPCELVKSNDNTPGIIIHPCPDAYTDDMSPDQSRNLKFIPTRRPPNYIS